ncbi:MAG: hypothetical protein PHU78_08430, partial [Heliobacteriaceae bacterium]|nr:hypothetical protein [Heliobacteriaceae bacterium]
MSLCDFPGAYEDKLNRRLVVPAYPRSVPPAALAARLVSIANRRRLDKIWLWSFSADAPAFENEGFQVEAVTAEAPEQKPTVSMAYFLDAARAVSPHTDLEDKILTTVCRQSPAAGPKPLPAEV